PQLALVRISSLGLGAVVDVLELVAIQGEGGAMAVDLEVQGRIAGGGDQLQAILDGHDPVRLRNVFMDRTFERSDMEGWSKLDPHRVAPEQPIGDVHGVLLMKHPHLLLHRGGVPDVIAPHGETRVQAELDQMTGARPLESTAGALLPTDLEPRAIREAEPL